MPRNWRSRRYGAEGFDIVVGLQIGSGRWGRRVGGLPRLGRVLGVCANYSVSSNLYCLDSRPYLDSMINL